MDQPIQPELAREIKGYVKAGYRVTDQTTTTAQLVKPKRFSLLWAVLWLLVFGVGILVYIFYYMSKKDSTVYLQWDGKRVNVTKG